MTTVRSPSQLSPSCSPYSSNPRHAAAAHHAASAPFLPTSSSFRSGWGTCGRLVHIRAGISIMVMMIVVAWSTLQIQIWSNPATLYYSYDHRGDSSSSSSSSSSGSISSSSSQQLPSWKGSKALSEHPLLRVAQQHQELLLKLQQQQQQLLDLQQQQQQPDQPLTTGEDNSDAQGDDTTSGNSRADVDQQGDDDGTGDDAEQAGGDGGGGDDEAAASKDDASQGQATMDDQETDSDDPTTASRPDDDVSSSSSSSQQKQQQRRQESPAQGDYSEQGPGDQAAAPQDDQLAGADDDKPSGDDDDTTTTTGAAAAQTADATPDEESGLEAPDEGQVSAPENDETTDDDDASTPEKVSGDDDAAAVEAKSDLSSEGDATSTTDDDAAAAASSSDVQDDDGVAPEDRLSLSQAGRSSLLEKKDDAAIINTSPERCAINFFGLPRAFRALVLPSLIRNVLQVNVQYHCDYFVHYYNLTQEASGRSGAGGVLDPDEILLLQEAVQRVHQDYAQKNPEQAAATVRAPVVRLVMTSEQEFWQEYADLIEVVRTAKAPDGKYLYFPWRAKTYDHPTTTNNIIKMWHSIQAAWNLMQQHAQESSASPYTQVAMLRSDVMYLTPLDIYQTHFDSSPRMADAAVSSPQLRERAAAASHQKADAAVVVPIFGRHPVSDRIIYGRAEAVRIWAAERFSRMNDHVQRMYQQEPGWGLHSERFVYYTLFSAIQEEAHCQVREHPTLCFVRARVDGTVWISDCFSGIESAAQTVLQQYLGEGKSPVRARVEEILGRTCGKETQLTRTVTSLDCSAALNVVPSA